MRNVLFNKVSVFVLALSLICIGTIPVLNAGLIKDTIDSSFNMGRKYSHTYLGDEADVPNWEVGDSWIFDIECSSHYEPLFSFNLSMRDLYFEVIDDYNGSYKVEFGGEVIGKLSIEDSSIVSGQLKDTILEGYILIEQDDLGIKRIDANINGFVIVPIIPQIPFEVNITLIFNPIYVYLDFPISVGKEWEIPATNISMDLWYNIAGTEKSFHFDIPLWKDIAECTGVENITVEAGTYETFHISSTLGITEYYYAPMAANIIRLFENEEEFDFVWELKSTTYGGPDKPDRPSGVTSGKTGIEYTYETTTIDHEEDQLYYWFEWGDGTNSGWIGPHNSGETASASHIWTETRNYEIKAKAKDEHGSESSWSDPLAISMPKNKAINTPFLRILENHPHLFPLIRQIMVL